MMNQPSQISRPETPEADVQSERLCSPVAQTAGIHPAWREFSNLQIPSILDSEPRRERSWSERPSEFIQSALLGQRHTMGAHLIAAGLSIAVGTLATFLSSDSGAKTSTLVGMLAAPPSYWVPFLFLLLKEEWKGQYDRSFVAKAVEKMTEYALLIGIVESTAGGLKYLAQTSLISKGGVSSTWASFAVQVGMALGATFLIPCAREAASRIFGYFTTKR